MQITNGLATIGRDNGGKGRRRILVWVLPVAVLVVVMAAALAGIYVNEYEDSRLRAETLLLSIEEDAAEQAIAEYQAIREGEVTPESPRTWRRTVVR